MGVVVTGAAGFLGRHLVALLRRRGVDVVALDQRKPADSRGTLLLADLVSGGEPVGAALRAADAVVHLAGCPGVRGRGPAVDSARWRDNVLASRRVLAEVPLRVPVLVASSSSVYGGSAAAPCAEADPLRPLGAYARSKVAVERLCEQRAARGGLVTVVRPFTVAGEGQRPDMALARWIAAAAAGRAVEVYGSLSRTRDVTDVRDVARCLVALLERGTTGTVNVGTGVGHSLGALVAAVGRALDVDVPVRVVPASDVEPPDTLADVRRLARLVGDVPRTDLDDLVARQAAAALAGRRPSRTVPALAGAAS